MMQRVSLIDNASGEKIHQGPHPFNVWSRHLCIKSCLPPHSEPVAGVSGAVLSGLSPSRVAQEPPPPASLLPLSRQKDYTFTRHLSNNGKFSIALPWWPPHLFFLTPQPSPHTSSYLFDRALRRKHKPSVQWLLNVLLQRKDWHFYFFLLCLWPLKISQIKSLIIYEG